MGRTYQIFGGSCHYRKVPYTRPYHITYLRTGDLRNFAWTIGVNSPAALSLRPECQFEIPCFTFGFYGRWGKEKVCLFIACPRSSTDTVLCFLCLEVFLTYFLFIYSFSLSFITTFLKNCLTSSRLPVCLFFMRKLDQEEHCSYWRGRPGEGGVTSLCVHKLSSNIVKFHFYLISQSSRGSLHFCFTFCFATRPAYFILGCFLYVK